MSNGKRRWTAPREAEELFGPVPEELRPCQLEQKFGAPPDDLRRRVDCADADTLMEWAGRILLADQLEHVSNGHFAKK